MGEQYNEDQYMESKSLVEDVVSQPDNVTMAELETPSVKPTASIWKILALNSAIAAINLAYTVQYTFNKPRLSEYKLSQTASNAVLLALPIPGLIQPIVGSYSDQYRSRFGRRRPFLFWSTIVTVLGMGLLAAATPISQAIYGTNDRFIPLALALYVIGLICTNLGVNIMQVPIRALTADLVAEDQRQLSNGICATVIGLSNLVGGLISFFDLSKPMPFLKNSFIATFAVGLILMVLSVIPTLVFAKEESSLHMGTNTVRQNALIRIVKSVRYMTKPLIKVAVVFFLSWFGVFFFLVNGSDYFGRVIYHGSPDGPTKSDYNDGVRASALAMMFNSLLMSVFSPTISYLVKKLGSKIVYTTTQTISAACFIALYWVQTKAAAYALFIIPALNTAVYNSIPFALICDMTEESESGLFMGVFNIFVVIAQTLSITAILGPIIDHTGNVAIGFLLSGCFCVCAAVAAFFLIPHFYVKPNLEEVKTSEVTPLTSGNSQKYD